MVLRISPDSAIAATPGAIGYNFTSANGTVQPAIICLTSADSSAPEDLVNPMIGAAGTGKGSCMPGPCLPFSSIYPSPETLSPAPSGYTAGKSIVGFAQLHTQGTGGTPTYGNFLITPSLTLRLTDANRASATSNEVAKAYAYSVRLTKDNILAEVTPSAHSAIYRFTFPNASNAYVSIDVARKVAGNLALKNGSVQVDPSTGTITGGGTYDRNWNPASYKVYFAARLLSTFPATGGTWVGSTAQDGVLQASTSTRQSLGAYLSFATVANQPVYLKVAVSFTSASKATEWLNAEIPAWDYEATSAAAALTWRRQLSAISVPGAAADNTTRIYTALWHSMVQPRNRTGDVPAYPAMAPLWDDHYTLWDTWKTLFPLMSILWPDMVRDNVNAFITRFQKNLPTGNGYVTEGFIQNKEFKVGQGGNEVDNVIAKAYVKGITGVKWNDAYTLIKYDADSVRTHGYRTRGWVGSDETGTGYTKRMRSGSGTLSFAYDDYCVSQVARGLGKTADAQTYLQRAGNWANVWDPTLTSEGYSGFAHSRKNDGTFSTTAATAGYNTDFYEGTCWEYSFFVPHDLPGLVSRMGGKPLFIQRLVHAFKQGYIQFNNEPSFMMIWLFDQVNRPYLASYWANEFLCQYDGMDLPGDDDSGAMSSLYIFLTSGLFPTSGQDIYYLHGAHVPKMIFHLPNGKTFTVTAQHVSSTNIFVQSATLNGQPLNVPLIHHSDIVAGGTLNFVMGSQASAWGTNGEFNAATAAAELAP